MILTCKIIFHQSNYLSVTTLIPPLPPKKAPFELADADFDILLAGALLQNVHLRQGCCWATDNKTPKIG